MLVLVAAVPTLASAWRAGRDWVPVGDAAAIALRATDVLSTNTPLVGMPTTLSDSVGQAIHHPGPLELWVIAVFQLALGNAVAPMVAIVAVNLGAIAAVVLCARSVAGYMGAAVGAAWVAVSSWSLRGDILIEPYNPYAAHLPLAAYLAATVAACRGRLWALPVAVVAGSYASQAHVSLLAPVGSVALAAVVATVARHGGVPTALRTARHAARDHRRVVAVTGAAAGVCWAPVLVDLIAGDRNLWHLVVSGRVEGATLGFDRAWQITARAITSPGWLDERRDAFEVVRAVGPATHLIALALLAASVGVVVWGWRRTPTLALSMLAALAALAAGTVAAAQVPTGVFNLFALPNYLWLWPVTGLLWVSLVATLATVVAERIDRRRLAWAPALATVLLVVAALLGALSPAVRTSATAEHGPPTVALSRDLAELLHPRATYLVEIDPFIERAAVAMGLIVELERHGLQVVVRAEQGGMFGAHRVHRDQPLAGHLLVAQDPRLPPAPTSDARLIASFLPDPDDLSRLQAVTAELSDAIRAGGGLVTGLERRRHTEAEVRGLVESRELLGLWDFGLIVSPQLSPRLMERYRQATNAAVLEVGVYLVPPRSRGG